MRVQKHWLFCLSALREVAPSDDSPFFAAEIGCAAGGNAASMLREFPSLRLTMADPWLADPDYVADIEHTRRKSAYLARHKLNQAWFDDQHRQAVEATEFAAGRRWILRIPSVDAAFTIPDRSLSFCFLDGDHREAGVAADLAAYWPKMKAGGIFAGHDYGTRGHDGVKRAVDAWAAKMGVKLELPGEYPRCWMVRVQ